MKGIGGSDAGVILGVNPWKSPYALWAEKTGLADLSIKDNEPMRQVILGVNPWKSPYALWAEKTGLADLSIKDNEPMRQGRDLEDYVARRFCEKEGKQVRRSGYSYQHPDHPWMRANVDRLLIGEQAGLECKTTSPVAAEDLKNGIVNESYILQCVHYLAVTANVDRLLIGEQAGLECKTTSPVAAEDLKNGIVNESYILQCVHYLAVTGLDRWNLCILPFQHEPQVFVIERDEDQIQALIRAEEEFWQLLQDRTPPAVDGSLSTKRALATLKIQPSPETLDLTSLADELDQYAILKDQIVELESRAREYENRICARMKDNSRGETKDWKVSYKSETREGIDEERLKQQHPEIYSECLKPVSSRRLRIRKDLRPNER